MTPNCCSTIETISPSVMTLGAVPPTTTCVISGVVDGEKPRMRFLSNPRSASWYFFSRKPSIAISGGKVDVDVREVEAAQLRLRAGDRVGDAELKDVRGHGPYLHLGHEIFKRPDRTPVAVVEACLKLGAARLVGVDVDLLGNGLETLAGIEVELR